VRGEVTQASFGFDLARNIAADDKKFNRVSRGAARAGVEFKPLRPGSGIECNVDTIRDSGLGGLHDRCAQGIAIVDGRQLRQVQARQGSAADQHCGHDTGLQDRAFRGNAKYHVACCFKQAVALRIDPGLHRCGAFEIDHPYVPDLRLPAASGVIHIYRFARHIAAAPLTRLKAEQGWRTSSPVPTNNGPETA
jgi:hypothetical protein